MSEPLSSTAITRHLAELPGWAWLDNALEATLSFATFREAMTFILRVSVVAEAMDHYPEWTNIRSTVIIRLNTLEAGSVVTEQDVDLARKILRLSRAM